MGITDWFKGNKPVQVEKEIRVFNGSQSATAKTLATVPTFFMNPALGVPRRVNILELRQYAKSPWVQMVINAIVKQVMTTDWDIVDEDEEDENDYETDINKVTTFLKFPNQNNETFYELFGAYLRDILEIDAGVIVKGRTSSGELTELYVHDGSRFLVDMNKYGQTEGYFQYSFNNPMGAPAPFGKDEIVYGSINKSTEHKPYGYSPLQSIVQEVELMIQSSRYNKEYFINNAVPDGIVSIPMDDPDQMERVRAAWEQLRGKAHKLLFLSNPGVDFKQLKTSNKDMEWLEGQKWYFHTIFGAYGLSPQEVGYYDNSSRATGDSQERITIKNAVKPYLKHIEDKINREIIPDLVGHDKIKFKWFPKDHVEEKVEHEQTMAKLAANVLTINEVRNREGLEDVEWGDQPIAFSQQDRFIENQPSQEEEKPSKEENKPVQDRDQRRDDAEEAKKKSLETFKKEVPEFIEQEEASDYETFLRRQFQSWEDKIFKFIDTTLEDEIIEKDVDLVSKSFGDFIRGVFNSINTAGFRDSIKRVIGFHVKEGVAEAEEQINMDVGISVNLNEKIGFLADRQLDGFQIDDKRWEGIKGVAHDAQLDIGNIVQKGLSNRDGLGSIKTQIKDYMDTLTGTESSEGRAMKIARTEVNRFRNAGSQQTYIDSGLKGKKVWMSLEDNRTSDICKRLDGVAVDVKDQFFSEVSNKHYEHPPGHPNCRARIIFRPD